MTSSQPIYHRIYGFQLQAQDFSAQESAILASVHARISGTTTVEEIIDYLFTRMQSVYQCDRISLALLEEDASRVVSHYVRTGYEAVHLDKGFADELQGSSLEPVLTEGISRVIDDLPGYLVRKPTSHPSRMLVAEGIKSSLAIPVNTNGRPLGVLFVDSRDPASFGEQAVRTHVAMAERINRAVDRSYQFARLQQANHAYTEMLGFIAHELKSPLAAIVMDSRLLHGEYLGDINNRQKAKLEAMLGKADYLLMLIRKYLDLAKLESGDLQLGNITTVDLRAELLEPAKEILAPQLEKNEVRLEEDLGEEPLLVEGDANLLRIVFVNLLGNAVKYGETPGQVRIRGRKGPEGFTLSVWNRGPGFPVQERANLFRKFSRLQTAELRKRPGTGVGLYTAWRIAHLHSGTIRADSEHGEWAQFTLTLPQPIPQPDTRPTMRLKKTTTRDAESTHEGS